MYGKLSFILYSTRVQTRDVIWVGEDVPGNNETIQKVN